MPRKRDFCQCGRLKGADAEICEKCHLRAIGMSTRFKEGEDHPNYDPRLHRQRNPNRYDD